MTYENGVLIAFLLASYSTVMTVVALNSTLNRNLHRIGERLSWTNLQARVMTDDDVNQSFLYKAFKFALLTTVNFAFTLLSWLYVLFWIGQFLYQKQKDSGVPQNIKEFRWKIRNVDMTFDQLVVELAKANGIAEQDFEEYKENLITDIRNRGIEPRNY